jgi:trehalose 6-phosphate synthase
MNLVSKEGPILNQRDGVLLLSENAGSFDELRECAIQVSPMDISSGAEALKMALTMEQEDRAAMSAKLQEKIKANTAVDWLGGQLDDIVRAEKLR